MSSLFSKSAIRQAISSFQGHDLSREISIVQELYDDFRKGNMKDETRYEQNFNELFFHQLLGYDPKINLHPKASTPVGSKIADVGLGFFEDGLYSYEGVKVVVELKGCDTLLDKKQASYGGQSPVDQGFGYKTSFKDCPWLIVSNFASVRLYRDNKQDFEVWTIEELANPDNDYYNLKTLLGLLKRNHLISQSGTSFSEKLLSEVRIKQEQITKDFYKQYKTLRFELINDIRHHNPEIHVETVVEKAQKIIDRIIFIHFCEDKGLLPEGKLKTNVIRAREADFSPWDVLKKYFKGVDSGSDKLEIPHGYNGGLFHTDPVLNDLEIGDAICHKFIDLGNYSFDDELSVNILGHIFEQSISDIEQLKVDLKSPLSPRSGEELSPMDNLPHPERRESIREVGLTQGVENKRKKDGIFYTPEYIVDYIVQNSLMVYLEEKEQACLDKIGKKSGHKNELEAYQEYKNILQNIKVLDPACGSGAFLVKVFDYLYAENKRVGQIVKSLFDDDEIYKSILRNNIYGVDLNPESVEITKLSLWLKSAQKGKKLNNLDDNIKCGNSLIDDPAVAGDRAFDWQKEFSDIMGAGGFDVIVGNPPYVSTKAINKLDRDFFWNKYADILFSEMDLYEIFIYTNINFLLKNEGYLSFITPNSFYTNKSFYKLREFLLTSTHLIEIIDFPYRFFPFEEVNTETTITIYKKTKPNKSFETQLSIVNKKSMSGNLNIIPGVFSKSNKIKQNMFNETLSGNIVIAIDEILLKIISCPNIMGDYIELHKGRMSIPSETIIENKKYSKGIFTKHEINTLLGLKEICNTYLEGKDIHRYYIDNTENYVNFSGMDKKTIGWHFSEKIILQRIVGQNKSKIFATLDDTNIIFPNANIINKRNDNKYNIKIFLGILNSKLISYFYNNYYGESNTNITKDAIESIPLPKIKDSSIINNIEKNVDLMLSLNKELHDKTEFFLRYISSKFGLEKLSTKLSKFYDYDFATFLKELKAVKLSMNEEAELMEFFESKKSEIVSLKNRIDATDREIDEMVYTLYGLNDEEKKIVEGS